MEPVDECTDRANDGGRSSRQEPSSGQNRRPSVTSHSINQTQQDSQSPNNIRGSQGSGSNNGSAHSSKPAPRKSFSETNGSDSLMNSFTSECEAADSGDDDGTIATRVQALRPRSTAKAKDMQLPQGEVTIIYTDVQGSTSMWESCPQAMKDATDIHDIIMRQCYADHSGYEITTEGDAFNLAFQHPVDALAFALQAQIKLYKADWPEDILKHPDGKDEPALKFRGFRVRFGIHHGITTNKAHQSTFRTVYSGEAVKIAKQVEGLCHGGQILTTVDTWMVVSGMAERYLGRPQVLDCGEHLLIDSVTPQGRPLCKRIMQLVPSELSFDFFAARGRSDVTDEGFTVKDASEVQGRLFPPLKSKRQLTTSFLNAPYGNGRVAICFVYTIGLKEDVPENRGPNMATVAKVLRKQLLRLDPPGYECQEDDGNWMLAFGRLASAVTFGLQLKSAIHRSEDIKGNVDKECMFKVGIVSGPFTSMGPHKTTGMADYFGPSINRAARVASICKPGQVCVGMPLASGDVAAAPDFGPSIDVSPMGIKKLKGITIDFAIYACGKKI